MNSPVADPARCPVCGGPNGCGVARGESSCWCVAAVIPADVLARLPAADQGARCVCAACAAGGRDVSAPGRARR